jgi:hypothetical protein
MKLIYKKDQHKNFNKELLLFHKENAWEILNKIKQNELLVKRISTFQQTSNIQTSNGDLDNISIGINFDNNLVLKNSGLPTKSDQTRRKSVYNNIRKSFIHGGFKPTPKPINFIKAATLIEQESPKSEEKIGKIVKNARKSMIPIDTHTSSLMSLSSLDKIGKF